MHTKSPRGFIGLGALIAIIIGLIVVGGGAYYVVHQSATTPTNTAPSAQNTPNTTQNTATPPAASNGTSNQPSATIDQSALHQEVVLDGSPVITGMVSNTDKITLHITGLKNLAHPDTTDGTFYINPPVNGRWSVTLPNSNIQWSPGTYPVEVRGANGSVLASGTLKVVLPAAVDQSSLNANAGRVTITGTAPTIPLIAVVLFGGSNRGQVASGTVQVVNGRWSFAANLSAGTYTVWLIDGTKPIRWGYNGGALMQGSVLWSSGYNSNLTVQ